MKIRTDFVTNSSSSCFAVEIYLQSVDGSVLETSVDLGDGGGSRSVNLTCSAQDIMHVSSVEALVQLLEDSLDIDGCNPAAFLAFTDREDLDEESDELLEEICDKFKLFVRRWGCVWGTREECEDVMASFRKFQDQVKAKLTDLSQIKKLEFRRVWDAWGEECSCFAANLDFFLPELPDLAKKVCTAKGEEKEAAKAELLKYLRETDCRVRAESDEFPTGFLGTDVQSVLVWEALTDDIEKFAQLVVKEKIPYESDHAKETVTIDLNKQEMSEKAEYILKK